MTKPILFWNRKKQQIETEQVYGDSLVRWAYGTSSGRFLAEKLLSKAWLSRAYGFYQSSELSAHKIEPFIRKFEIPMEEYEPGPFANFNEFFIRKFKPGARSFANDSNVMPAFAEARYFAYDRLETGKKIPVKGVSLEPTALLGSLEKAKPFVGGPVLLARLCPTDYHRFHFPDSGKVLKSYRIPGTLHSVNPIALDFNGDILITNEREVSFLETENFGQIAYIEVGAAGVGRIVQSHLGEHFQRGDEKGYFLFGGSTVIVLGEPGKWRPDQDLLEKTSQGIETFIQLGDHLAVRVLN